ncbi:unnamed protein product, partial [Cylicostephanus goldi]
MKAFLKRTKNRTKDILVHYIPCNFTGDEVDDDVKEIAEILKNDVRLSEKTSLVSNTMKKEEVAAAFHVNLTDIGNMVIDKEQNIAEGIEVI